MRRLEDLEAVVRAGADFVGVNLWPGTPRYADAETAARLVEAARPTKTTPVAVLVDPSNDDLAKASDLGFSWFQIHGAFDAEALPPFAKKILAVSIGSPEDLSGIASAEDSILLLDARRPGYRGGTGLAFDWKLAVEVAASRRVLLAGGLTPENVEEAIATVKPWGVDVASGVEVEPGVKDAEKITTFVKRCRALV